MSLIVLTRTLVTTDKAREIYAILQSKASAGRESVWYFQEADTSMIVCARDLLEQCTQRKNGNKYKWVGTVLDDDGSVTPTKGEKG